MFDMSNDSGLFRTREQLEADGWQLAGNAFVRGDAEPECYLPLYEAKLFHQYDHRFATFDGVAAKDLKGGKAEPMTAAEKADSQAVVLPRYWVPEEEVKKRLDKTETAPFLTSDKTLNALTELARNSLSERLSEQPTSDGDLRHDAVLWSE